MIQSLRYGVCVSCDTYNQSAYIKDTLDGFTLQKTNFPFVCTIMDDASTDGEQQVLLNYLKEQFAVEEEGVAYYKETSTAHIHYARHRTNTNCFFAVVLLKENYYSKGRDKRPNVLEWREASTYFALCEGDDYWISPNKLQMQYDFLENHPDYGMCYTNFNMYFQQQGIMVKDLAHRNPKQFPMRYANAEDFVVAKQYVCPPSWLIRYSVYRTYEPMPKCCDATFVMFTHFLCKSKTYYMDTITSVYRILTESASHSKNPLVYLERQKLLLELQYKLIEIYQLDPATRKRCKEGYYKDNLVFFAENHMTAELNAMQKVVSPLNMRERILLFLGQFSYTARLLTWIHQKRSLRLISQ